MKHFIAAMTCLLVGWCTLFGQCTFNGGTDKYCIQDLSITYRDNKFIISGYEVNSSFLLQNNNEVPAIAIFIETGDGKYISARLTPSGNGDTAIFYNYPAMNRDYTFRGEATKNYDGGGPRRVAIPPQTANQNQQATSSDAPYIMQPSTTFTVSAFPRDIVQDDSITLVIETDPFHFQNLYFHYDTRLVIDQPDYGNNFQKMSSSHDGTYKIQKFSVSDYEPGSGIKIAYIRIKPDANFVAGIPMNTTAPPFYVSTNGRVSNALATTTLKVLASHDPNNMSLYFCDFCPQHNCPHVSRHRTRNEPITFHYTVDFENAGTNNEDSVIVTYYCRVQHLQETVTITDPVFAGKPYTLKAYGELTRLDVGEVSEGLHARGPVGSATFPFKGELRGTNNLPYGDPATRGSVNFTLQTKKKFRDLSPDDKITAWAEITFVSAKETIKTNEINTTRKDFAKYYNRRCICQNTFVLFRWVCRLFRGI